MYSLLTEEIKNYNLENNNLIKNKEKTNFQKNTININDENDFEKKVISNIKKNSSLKSLLNEEYSINIHIFNPMKNSPPNNWNYRLLSRINSLNDLNSN
jgi:hypothetical protein